MTDKASGTFGTLSTALAQASKLLATNPAMAETQSREILRIVPDYPQALLVLGVALRSQGNAAAARKVLEPLAASQPKAAGAQFELGLTLADLGEGKEAIAALSRSAKLDAGLPHVWLALADQLTLAGDSAAADDAYASHIKASVKDSQLLKAAAALCENKLAFAERALRGFLKLHPTDVAAIRMLAETGARLGHYEDAEKLLARCMELAPGFDAARHNYATVLYRQNKPAEALAQVGVLLKRDPRNPNYRNLRASALARLGETEQAILAYQSVLKDYPNHPKGWMSYGHTLKTAGRQQECIAAYRKSIAQLPSLGEAYWSLANLKTFRFTPAEIAAMRAQLARKDLVEEDLLHFHFALGKALEDEGRYGESFEQYEKGNALRKAALGYKADETSAHVKRCITLFTAEFFLKRESVGSPAPDPIFIVGLPRSGSTLIEQILSSHSAVEGTMELPDIMAIARRLGGKKKKKEASDYPEILAMLNPGMFGTLGEEYLQRTRIQRRLGRPFFIDKMPNNFLYVGLIHLILPKAKIIDARRHPLGCCFSCFKQHFARGQGFTYGLADIGRYYADYVRLMAHFDRMLPGRVHRILYEDLVGNPEQEVRRLLAYCGLPFEEACLRFYETARAVRTASSEQVRMPIFTEALEHWRNFEPWLEPLKEALGPVLTAYPAAPIS